MRKFKCPKCESDNVSIRHREKDVVIQGSVEKLICKCQTCEYRWTEEPSNLEA